MSNVVSIPDSVLQAAERLTVKDLLECPAFQAFFVSAVGNSIQSFHEFADVMDERDEFVMFRLQKMFKSIPYDTRRILFDEVGRLYSARREERENRR